MDSFTLSHSLNAMMCGLAAQKQGFGARTSDATRLHARRRDGAQTTIIEDGATLPLVSL